MFIGFLSGMMGMAVSPGVCSLPWRMAVGLARFFFLVLF